MTLLLWTLVIGGAFAFAWKKGYLARLGVYIGETQEELKKCTWPTWDELKGSTLVVLISSLMIGAFTVGVDVVISYVMKALLS